MSDEIKLTKYSKKILENSWHWLNDPEIKQLTATPDFTKEEQLEWYHSLPRKNDYLIWGITFAKEPIGVCGLKNITDHDCEYWGYIGNKEYWGRGIGKIIMTKLEDIAKDLPVKSIWLKVIKENERAIALYKKMGYEIEKEKELLIMRKYL